MKFRDTITKRCKYDSNQRWQEANERVKELKSILDSGKRPEKRRSQFIPLTFNKVSESLKLEWIGRNKRNDLADKTLYEYIVRLDVVCRTFGTKMLIEIKRKISRIILIRSLSTGQTLLRIRPSQPSRKCFDMA